MFPISVVLDNLLIPVPVVAFFESAAEQIHQLIVYSYNYRILMLKPNSIVGWLCNGDLLHLFLDKMLCGKLNLLKMASILVVKGVP